MSKKSCHRSCIWIFAVAILVAPVGHQQGCSESLSSLFDSLDTRSPRFASLQDTTEITDVREIRTYPSFSVNVGPILGFLNTDDLNGSYGRMEEAYGVLNRGAFGDQKVSVTTGLRLHISRRVAAWWEYVYGGEPGNNDMRVSMISFSALYSPLVSGNFSISVGSGVAQLRLGAMRDYGTGIGGGRRLEKITVKDLRKTGIPLILLLEYHGRSMQRHMLYASAHYIIIDDVTRSATLPDTINPDDRNVPIKVSLRSLWLSAGIAIGF